MRDLDREFKECIGNSIVEILKHKTWRHENNEVRIELDYRGYTHDLGVFTFREGVPVAHARVTSVEDDENDK